MKLFLLIPVLLFLSCATNIYYVHKNKAACFGGIAGYLEYRIQVYQDSCEVVGMNGQYFELECK